MKRIVIYSNGFIIGMIAEYCFRVSFGYLQGSILLLLLLRMIIDVIDNWNN